MAVLTDLTEQQAAELQWDWRFWARANQIEPPGDWYTWLVLAGRGFGKTETGAQWVRERVRNGARSIALVAETQKDLEEVMVARILAVHPPEEAPTVRYKPVRLVWPNGAVGLGYNGTEPDQLRGPEFDTAWVDELAKYRYAQDTWDMLQFTMRIGTPRQIVTTTPRPIPIIRQLLKDPSCVVTRGNTYENRANLAPVFFEKITKRYEGTRLGRQELKAEVLDDSPDALWTRANLDEKRRKIEDLPRMERIVVAIDPAAKTNEQPEDGAATGIVAAALGEDGRGYVLEDATLRARPNGWARQAVAVFDKYGADCIVGEANNGGDMVESTVRSVREFAPFKAVHASRGKWIRAEPIAALYEQGRVSHVGTFPELEDEMVVFGPNGMPDGSSPDRLDALVWALTELFPQMIMSSSALEDDGSHKRIQPGRSKVTGY